MAIKMVGTDVDAVALAGTLLLQPAADRENRDLTEINAHLRAANASLDRAIAICQDGSSKIEETLRLSMGVRIKDARADVAWQSKRLADLGVS